MTVGAAFSLGKQGWVLAVDMRITKGNTLSSDRFGKWLELGSLVAAFAGDVGAFQDAARQWQANEVSDLDGAVKHLHRGGEFEALVIDRADGFMGVLDNTGALVATSGSFQVVGCGADYLSGFLDASKAPKTVQEAGKLLRAAVASCSERDLAVSKKCQLVAIPRIGKLRTT